MDSPELCNFGLKMKAISFIFTYFFQQQQFTQFLWCGRQDINIGCYSDDAIPSHLQGSEGPQERAVKRPSHTQATQSETALIAGRPVHAVGVLEGDLTWPGAR